MNSNVMTRLLRPVVSMILVLGLSACLVSKTPISAGTGTIHPFSKATTMRMDIWDTDMLDYVPGEQVTFAPFKGEIDGWTYEYKASFKNDEFAIKFIEVGDGQFAIEAYSTEDKKFYYVRMNATQADAVYLSLYGFLEGGSGDTPKCLMPEEDCWITNLAELKEAFRIADTHDIRPEYRLPGGFFKTK